METKMPFDKMSRVIKILAKKTKIMPLEIRKENHNCFYKYEIGCK